MSSYFTHIKTPDNVVFPLIVFRHQRTFPTKKTKPDVNKALGEIDDGSWCDKKMIIVSNLIFHESSMLEMSIK